MKATIPMEKMRFASCVRMTRLLQVLPEAARRVVDGEAFMISTAFVNFNASFRPTPKHKINLTRREVFRGKISQRKNQQNQTDLEERTRFAPQQ